MRESCPRPRDLLFRAAVPHSEIQCSGEQHPSARPWGGNLWQSGCRWELWSGSWAGHSSFRWPQEQQAGTSAGHRFPAKPFEHPTFLLCHLRVTCLMVTVCPCHCSFFPRARKIIVISVIIAREPQTYKEG